jgi:hypothetical protein
MGMVDGLPGLLDDLDLLDLDDESSFVTDADVYELDVKRVEPKEWWSDSPGSLWSHSPQLPTGLAPMVRLGPHCWYENLVGCRSGLTSCVYGAWSPFLA